MRRALRRAADGRSLDVAEAAVLLTARGASLDGLLAVAGAVRDAGLADAGRPGIVTFSKKVFIPLTRLCRDRCHYCTFATVPSRLPAEYLELDEVLAIAREGAAQGCKEALFTLGDRPEERWPQAKRWLDQRGYDSTLDYLRACAMAVLEQTGLLPHLNPGVLSWSDLQRLKPVAPSMGMMLETTATRLWSEPGGPHYASPDKEPAVRLRVLEDAGRVGVPFTTGILIGIGENLDERAESLFAIRKVSREYGHIQEVIVQNFRAKPDTAMRGMPDAELHDLAATIAVARLVLGPKARIQAPPNLIDDEYALLLRAGIDDWGGVSPVTPDHVNPERPWPAIEELARQSQNAGFTLRERLTVYPEYAMKGDPWIDTRLIGHVAALMEPATGLAVEDARAVGRPWQEPDGGFGDTGRVDLHESIDVTGRTADRRGDFDSVYGDWDEVAARVPHLAPVAGLDADVREGAAPRRRRPGGAAGAQARGRGARTVQCGRSRAGRARAYRRRPAPRHGRRRRDVRRESQHQLLQRLLRRLPVLRVRPARARRGRLPALASSRSPTAPRRPGGPARPRCACRAASTRSCRSVPMPKWYERSRRASRACTSTRSARWRSSPARRRPACRSATGCPTCATPGLDTIPGTAAEILDDEVRWVLTKGKLPTATWVEVVSTAHQLGIRSSATMMYGHVDHPRHWLGHFRVLADIQDRTGGFTEFVGLPFVHHSAPIYLAGIARPGPTWRENRAVHAMARVLLHGRIANIQCSWVKLGDDGTAAMLNGGANDLGGTLMEETISRMAGSEHGSARTVADLEAIAAKAGRPARQRTTVYGNR